MYPQIVFAAHLIGFRFGNLFEILLAMINGRLEVNCEHKNYFRRFLMKH